MTQKIILDCDPGIDDALAIAFARGSPDLTLLGITTVAGNVSLDKTTANALRVCDFLGWPELPVLAGSAAPLLRPAMTGRGVHGASGLGAARLAGPGRRAQPGHATDFLIDTIAAAPGEITLVATGPLTNVALAVRREPGLASHVRDFVIMGGSCARGSVTPAAEFNIAADPEAAAIVFAAGWTVTMVGLDVTRQATAGRAVIDRIRGLGRLADELVLPCLRSHAGPPDDPVTAAGLTAAGRRRPGGADPAVHDVCAVARAARPGLLGCFPARVEIETAGRWTSGMTVADFSAPPSARNAMVALSIDVSGFWDLVIDSYRRVATALDS